MKIVYLADTENVHTRKWVDYFVDQGVDVTCISFSDQSIPSTKHLIIDESLAHQINPALPLRKKAKYLRRLRKIRRWVLDEKPDILHAHYASSYGLIGGLCGFHPFVISAWGSDIMDFPRKSMLTKGVLRFSLSRADVICSTSQSLANEIKKYTNKRSIITPFGVDTKKFKPDAPKKRNETIIIGTVKRLETVYGIDILLKTFKLITERHPNCRLRIVGDGTKRGALTKLAEQLGIADGVEFLGHVNHDLIPQCLRGFDVFMALSRHESFGVAVLESMSCGVPVVVSDVDGLSEIVTNGKTGFAVEPNSPVAAASAVEALLTDDQLYTSIVDQAREFIVELFDWEKNASGMAKVYNEIVTAKR